MEDKRLKGLYVVFVDIDFVYWVLLFMNCIFECYFFIMIGRSLDLVIWGNVYIFL